MSKQFFILFLILYAIHVYNPKYVEWFKENIRNMQIFGIICAIIFIYRSDDFDEYTKKTFELFKKIDSEPSLFVDHLKNKKTSNL